jgi:hypothetical protein
MKLPGKVGIVTVTQQAISVARLGGFRAEKSKKN